MSCEMKNFPRVVKDIFLGTAQNVPTCFTLFYGSPLPKARKVKFSFIINKM